MLKNVQLKYRGILVEKNQRDVVGTYKTFSITYLFPRNSLNLEFKLLYELH